MVWKWLQTLFRARRRQPGRVVMYTRRGCHLCDDTWVLLEEARARHGFALEKVDVDAEPELVARYGSEVPVVEIDGRVRFRGRVNPVLLRRVWG
jgi:glutaredoxin